MDYKHTIKLPSTGFPMRAELPKREPAILKLWKDAGMYDQIINKRKDAKTFHLHDGPPFANGNAHMGHALNKALKDFVLKSRHMMGFQVPFVPGWDCHGLPIEHRVAQELEKSGGNLNQQTPGDIRRKCETYARKYIAIQSEQFQRLGIFGDWENPYLTMDPAYEAEILRAIATMVEKNLIYQGMRPVYWSSGCQTALAEAEVEYQDRNDLSVFVKFPFTAESIAKVGLPAGADASIIIWTTTPWTLPSNLAVAVHAKLPYVIAECEGKYYLCSEHRMAAVAEAGGKNLTIFKKFAGTELTGLTYHHPFIKRESKVWTADFVTEESGTGLVHIAPGHGRDDYELGMKCGLEPLSPVDDYGKLTEECGVPSLIGKYVFDANEEVKKILEQSNHLWAAQNYLHSYPHCWRSKTPIVFRCVKQWFIKVDAFRADAIKAIEKVQWVPEWGINRIKGAVESRPDWCISRQRTWGVPIPVFYDAKNQPVLRGDVIRKFADIAEKEGTNTWFDTKDGELATRLGLDSNLRKGLETLDVWIDSGVSHTAVVKKRLSYPADLYLEGSDQHRGWFQSSLLTAIPLYNEPPYKAVVTNGFVVDVDGKKLSKSNTYQKPTGLIDFVNLYGGDVLRLWVASEDYRNDVPFSEEIFTHVSDTYRLFRNSLRILLGNLDGFDPARDSVPEEQWSELEVYIISKLQDVVKAAWAGYETYEFHQVYHALNRFCAVELSALYVDVLKDRMYCDSTKDIRRRAAQTAMHEIVETVCKLLAPLTPFTAEEAWQQLADKNWNSTALVRESIHLQSFPKAREIKGAQGLQERWTKLLDLRSKANEQLEQARQAKRIGKSLEASLEITTPDFGPEIQKLLEELLIVSRVELKQGNEISVKADKAKGKKCCRCWKQDEETGADATHPDLCPRCTRVVNEDYAVPA